jgi:gamma-glutamyltranspeptidase
MNSTEIESNFCPSSDGKASFSVNGIVSTASRWATDIGAGILKNGGNAVVAAVAAALALGIWGR